MTYTTIGLLSTYPPTQCGLATFSAALRAELCRGQEAEVGVVRVVDHPDPCGDPAVVAHLLNGSANSARDAVACLNSYDAVVVQHEYGIYGGPDGCDVVDLVEALTVPTIVVFHTVLQEPTARQRHILRRLLDSADVAVTMTETARTRLVEGYGADPMCVTVIPHGAIDLGGERPSSSSGRPLILTWGLLGPGKGIEWAIDAMPALLDLHPRYLVTGKTHPKVLDRHGEDYRRGLRQRADRRGVGHLVELDDSYLGVGELAALVGAADVVLLPYDSREQVTSGVLIEAVAAGRPVVSTAFPHAVELLPDGPGIVVPQRDPAALAWALRRVLTEPGLGARMAAQAALKAPELFWGAVAERYRQLAVRLVAEAMVAAS
jgi:polysaccharide biosynthesis protein PslF